MIAKSDLVILAIASAVLVYGLGNMDSNNASKSSRVTTTAVPANTSAQVTQGSLPNGAASYRQPDNANTSGNNLTPSVTLSSTPVDQQNDNQTRTVIMQASGQSTDAIVPLASVPVANVPVTNTGALATTRLSSTDNGVSTGSVAATTLIQPESTDRYVMLTHTVKSGEYLNLLAKRYDTSVEELQQINGLNGTVIQVGQDLLYPAKQ